MIEILYFSEALLSFICLIIFVMIWLTGTRYWLRLLIYNKQVNAKLIDVRYSKDKKSCYGILSTAIGVEFTTALRYIH